MKYIIVLLFSLNAFATMWTNPEDLSAPSYTSQAGCLKAQARCLEIPEGEYKSDLVEVDVEENDYSKPPILTTPKEESCSDVENCMLHNADNNFCVPGDVFYYGDRDEDGDLEAWCVHTEYQQKTVKRLQVDEAKKATRLAAEAENQAKETAIALAQKYMACGRRAIAYITALNLTKDPAPSVAEIQALNASLADIKNQLETGSLVTAAQAIQALDLSESIITESDRTKILAEISSCSGG